MKSVVVDDEIGCKGGSEAAQHENQEAEDRLPAFDPPRLNV